MSITASISFAFIPRANIFARSGGCGCEAPGMEEVDADTTEEELQPEEEISGEDLLEEEAPEETPGDEPTCIPTAEICDSIDNDCDGETDEELINACGICGPLPPEICNGIDDNCNGQTDEDWHKTFTGGYTASSVEQTSDGGYILASGNSLIKTDASGNLVWQEHYSAEDNEDISSVIQTLDGGYIAAGSTRPEGEGNEGADAWLLKVGPSGSVEWSRVLDGVEANADWFSSVQQTTDGGYITAGVTGGDYGTGNANFWLMKFDASGDREWDKIFDGGNLDYASWVQQTTDGGYIIAGVTGFSFGGAEDADGWVIKTDPLGNREWDQVFGGSNDDSFSSVWQTTDGGYLLAGTTESFGAGREDLWILKTDRLGIKEWDTIFGGDDSDYASFAQQTTDGGYVLFGTTNSFPTGVYSGDLWIIKANALGATEWEIIRDIDNHDSVSSGRQTSDGGYVVAGHAGLYDNSVLLAKFCPPSE